MKEYRCENCGNIAPKYQKLCVNCFQKRKLCREFEKVAKELQEIIRRKREQRENDGRNDI